jgi:hypothetical protein
VEDLRHVVSHKLIISSYLDSSELNQLALPEAPDGCPEIQVSSAEGWRCAEVAGSKLLRYAQRPIKRRGISFQVKSRFSLRTGGGG